MGEQSKAYTTAQFVAKAVKTHGRKYDYARTIYVNAKTKVKIRCPEHGVFEQIPWWHMHSQGCPKCGGTAKSNTPDFVASAKKVHGSTYSYEKVKYTTSKEHVVITCEVHGDFKQTPDAHLAGKGCVHCGQAKVRTHRYKVVRVEGRRFKVQGYEPFAIKYMVRELGVNVLDLEFGKTIPTVNYKFGKRTRTHYPDFWVPKQNRLVEVKSAWTLGIVGVRKHKDYFEEIKAKRSAAIAAGFKYSVLVFNGAGERLPLPKDWYKRTKHQVVKAIEAKHCSIR